MAHCEEMVASGADTVCKSKGVKSIRQRETIRDLEKEVRALRLRVETAEKLLGIPASAAEELGTQMAYIASLIVRAETAEKDAAEAYAKGLTKSATIVEEEGQDNCSCIDGVKCESCYTVDDILARLKAVT